MFKAKYLAVVARKKMFYGGILTLILFYFFSRFYSLTSFPIFCDEAIYIRWAQVIKSIPSLWWVPLSDGKQPLFMWLVSGTLYLWHDPLIAGRFVSGVAGFGELAAIYYLARNVFKGRVAILAALLYALVPFMLFFNRLALVDGLLSFLITVSFLLAIILARRRRLWISLSLGISLGGAMLTKSPGEVFLFITPMVSLFWYLKQQPTSLRNVIKERDFWRFAVYLAFAGLVALSLYNLLRLAPVFYMIARRNKDYLWGWNSLRQHPFDPLLPHLRDTWRYYIHYLTRPILLASAAGLIYLLKQRRWPEILILTLWWLPVIPMAAIAKVFTARYILYSAMPLLLLAAVGLIWINKISRWMFFLLMAAILFATLSFGAKLWSNPLETPLPKDEYRGYISDWTAGEGIREIARYLRQQPKDERIVVATEGFFGTLPNGLQIYFDKSSKITVIGGSVETTKIPATLLNARRAGDKAYLVVNSSRFKVKNTNGLKLISRYPKPGGDALLFWEVTD